MQAFSLDLEDLRDQA